LNRSGDSSVPRTLQISNVHNHEPIFLKLPALVLGTRSLLEPIPVLVEARERSTISGSSFLNIIKGIVRDPNWHQRRAIAHRKPHAPYRVPRWIPDR
jgi:hypothetical protein